MHTSRSMLLVGVVVAGCGTATGPHDGPPDAPAQCAAGPRHCAGNTLQLCVDGAYQDEQACPQACSDALGCVVCVPGTGTCESDTLSHSCNATGTGYDEVTCDPVQGMSCGATTGVCEGACSPQSLGQSYIGCEYYPTVTGNVVPSAYQFAVAIANTTELLATVTIEDGALTAPDVVTVPPHGVRIERLPWQPALKLCLAPTANECFNGKQSDGALVAHGAFHLRSTVPVTVYQFSPLDYVLPDVAGSSVSNDASLLLPTNAWRRSYYAASWGVTQQTSSELAVTAAFDATQVTITTRAAMIAGGGAPAFSIGVPKTVTLDAGTVLEITSRTGDLTGSQVTSDKPVQVISGHYCANVPLDKSFCDHLEESMFPIDAMGSRYVVAAPSVSSSADPRVQVVRVIATSADTQLTYDPPQPRAPTTIAGAGDFIEIASTSASFMISSNRKVLVAQYMEGSLATPDNVGDPSMTLTVPIEQFRSTYLFHAPTNYATNYVDVVAPTGATITLDGTALVFQPVGTTGFGLSRVVPLRSGPGHDGNHSITGTMPFGISVYGYGADTSYWYPGGLELHDIPVN